MSDSSENAPRLGTPAGIPYTETSAPILYFDGVSCHGVMHGVIEIELAARIMAPTMDGKVHMSFVPAARLRCSPIAAAALLDSIQKATKMIEQAQQGAPAEASKLN